MVGLTVKGRRHLPLLQPGSSTALPTFLPPAWTPGAGYLPTGWDNQGQGF